MRGEGRGGREQELLLGQDRAGGAQAERDKKRRLPPGQLRAQLPDGAVHAESGALGGDPARLHGHVPSVPRRCRAPILAPLGAAALLADGTAQRGSEVAQDGLAQHRGAPAGARRPPQEDCPPARPHDGLLQDLQLSALQEDQTETVFSLNRRCLFNPVNDFFLFYKILAVC